MTQNKAWKKVTDFELFFAVLLNVGSRKHFIWLFMRGFLHHEIRLRCCNLVSNQLQGKVVGVQSIVACPVPSLVYATDIFARVLVTMIFSQSFTVLTRQFLLSLSLFYQ